METKQQPQDKNEEEKDEKKEKQVEMSELNPKYPKMLDEYIYKDVLFVYWANRSAIEAIETDFRFHNDDVMIATFPKSGTTLMQELAWLVLNDANFDVARSQRVFIRVPFVEENWPSHFPGHPDGCLPIEYLPEMPRPRVIKTHLPFHIIGPRLHENGVKTIVVLRNPKDTMVSYYHFYKGIEDYGPWPWDFRRFFRMWMDRWIVAGDWFRVTKDWWAQRHRPNILIVKFEDVVRQPRREIRRVAEFLGRQQLDSSLVDAIADAVSFDSMRRNPATNYEGVPGMLPNFSFMRAGQIGNWKKFFTVSESEEFDRVYREEMRDTELELDFE